MTDEQYYRLYLDGDETGLSELMKKYGIDRDYAKIFRERYSEQKKDEYRQISLFD